MIQNPIGIAAVLIGIEVVILFLSEQAASKKFFMFLPAVFWIYFLPMVFSTLNVLPPQSAFYENISAYFLPSALFLLLLSVDIPSILKLGKQALIMMLVGSLGIVLGAPLMLWLFKARLPPEAWSGFGALSGSWVGGSANMMAVKEMIKTPDAIFVPMIAVDVIVAYSWMGILIALAGYQKVYDRWNDSNVRILEELHQRVEAKGLCNTQRTEILSTGGIIVLAFSVALISNQLGRLIPEIKGINAFTWTILIISIFAMMLSFTPLKKLAVYGTSDIGYLMLYFVLASMGAKANLMYLAAAPFFILAGFIWVFFHFFVMLIAAKLTKSPLALVATASQANIGGPVSAPIVAAVYQPSLAPVGLLLGIFGNVIGTYTGLLCAQLCYWVSQF